MRRVLRRLIFWGAVIAWMAVIFSFSAQDKGTSKELSQNLTQKVAQAVVSKFEQKSPPEKNNIISVLDNVIRKLAHVFNYAVLGILCFAALLQHDIKLRLLWAVAISGVYAVTDEVHQYFTGRGAMASDVLLDTVAALLGALALWLLIKLIKKIKSQKPRCA